MTRDEVIKGLEAGLIGYAVAGKPLGPSFSGTLRAALSLLRVPESAEIEATRAWLCSHDWIAFSGNGEPITVLLEKALDALAREPGLEARIRKLDDANIAERQYNGEANERARDLNRRIAAMEEADSAHRYTISELIKANERMSVKLARVRTRLSNTVESVCEGATNAKMQGHLVEDVIDLLATDLADEAMP